MDHLSNWIEIPAADLNRARAFYETILNEPLSLIEQGGVRYALFSTRSVSNAGALVQGDGYAPSPAGPLVYLDGSAGIDAMLARIEAAGGRVLMPRTLLSPEAGEVAIFLDSEGNRVGIQAAPRDDAPVRDDVLRRALAATAPGVAFLIRRGPRYGEETAALQWEHARNLFGLLRAGKLRSVSAFVDGVDVLGVGLWSGERAEAEATLREDPGVRGGRFTFELLSDATFTRDTTRV